MRDLNELEIELLSKSLDISKGEYYFDCVARFDSYIVKTNDSMCYYDRFVVRKNFQGVYELAKLSRNWVEGSLCKNISKTNFLAIEPEISQDMARRVYRFWLLLNINTLEFITTKIKKFGINHAKGFDDFYKNVSRFNIDVEVHHQVQSSILSPSTFIFVIYTNNDSWELEVDFKNEFKLLNISKIIY